MPQAPGLNFDGIPDQGGPQASTPASPAATALDFSGIADGPATGNKQPSELPVASQTKPSAYGVGKALLAPMDPRTPSGRQNLAGAAAAIGMGLATEGMGALPWITRILATPAAAALGGMAAEGGEQLAGTKPVDVSAIGHAGLEQGAYEVFGKAALWPVQKALTTFKAAPAVAKQAAQWVEDNLTGAKHAASDLVADATTRGRNYLKGITQSTRQDLQLVKDRAAKTLRDDAAAIDVWQQDQVATARQVYDRLQAPTEAIQGARQGAHDLTRLTAPRGASQVGLDVAGQKIGAAAATGPALPLQPVQTAIEQLLVEAHPGTIFQPAEKATGIGFLDNLRARRQGEAAAGVATSADQIKLTERIAQAMGLSPADLAGAGIEGRVKELTNLLGRVMTTRETTMPFAEAHQLKKLLDESIKWDRRAKTAMERITKGARQTLNDQLRTHAPYVAANAEYAKQVQLYTDGAGKALIKAARSSPDRVVQLLKPDQPAAAQQIKDLLVTQAAKGGDPVAGHQAWQDLQSAFVYEHLVKGGPEKLSQRIGQLLTASPEFAKVVLGDQTAQRVVSNLDRIGQAYTSAIDAASQIAEQNTARSRTAVQQGVDTARHAAADRLTVARGAVQDAKATAKGVGQLGVDTARETRREFAKSGIARYEKPVLESSGADVLRGVGLGPKSIWGALSLMRLLDGPSAAELTQWAAHSDRNTQRLVAALHSQLPPAGVAALLREMVGYASQHDAADPPTRSPQ